MRTLNGNGHKKPRTLRAVEPRPVLCGRHQLAAVLGVHADRITEYRNAGMPVVYVGGLGGAPDDRKSRYDAIACSRWVRAHRQGALDAIQERAKLDAKRREDLDFKLAVRRGEYVLTREVERMYSGYVITCRDKLLAIPSRMKLRCPTLSDNDIRIIDELIREALTELAERHGQADEEEKTS